MSVDLNAIKNEIQDILLASNTTTASRDLSQNIDAGRVQNVYKVNPQRIPTQASQYPLVSIFFDGKDITPQTIAKNQLSAKREASIDLKIIGAIWNNQYTTIDEDEADNDIENLMENIEEILRQNGTLNNYVLWQMPTDVSFHTLPNITEDAHLRAGLMSLRCRIYY